MDGLRSDGPPGDRRVGIAFTGGALAALGYSLLFAILCLLLVPGAWGAAAFLGWWTGSLAFDDGGRATFEGRPGRIWPLFAALVVLALLPGLAASLASHGHKPNSGLQIVLTVVLLPLNAALMLPVYRWAIEGVRLNPGGAPRFTGGYAAYLGWSLLLLASIVTVVGWAWVAVAMIRWFCRHTRGDGYDVAFVGTGWGYLWRVVVWILGLTLIVPIPWVLRSMYAWLARNIVILRHDTQGELSSFPA